MSKDRISQLFDVSGKNILISGATSGIGASIAELFSFQCVNLAISGRRVERLNSLAERLSQNGSKVLPIECDVRNDGDVIRTVSKVAEEFGSIDILINAAGITEKSEDIATHSRIQWNNVIETDLSGTYAMCREAASVMKVQQYGKIINIASMVAFMGFSNQVSYVAAKSGVVGLTKAAAVELGKYNITVNAIAPGYTLTEMTNPKSGGCKYFTGRSVLGRVGTTEDLHGAVMLLASDASKFISGTVITVDGGVTANI